MTVHVIGCGESAEGWADWSDASDWISIGVNDAFKWGYDFTYLFLVDPPENFRNEPERMKIIKCTDPAALVSFSMRWKAHFPGTTFDLEKSQIFTNKIVPGRQYHSKTSTFAAMSYALNMGATEIVLHGIDLNTHHLFKPGKKAREFEIRQYAAFAEQAKLKGVRICVSSETSALSKHLPIWTH